MMPLSSSCDMSQQTQSGDVSPHPKMGTSVFSYSLSVRILPIFVQFNRHKISPVGAALAVHFNND